MGDEMTLPSVLSYSDFKVFLRDFYHAKKKLDPYFSYQVFSKIAGLGSPNYYKLVMEGERALSVDNIHKFATGLGLDSVEQEWFECLVLFQQSHSVEGREFYEKRLRRLSQKNETKLRCNLAKSQMRVLESPRFPFILLAAHKAPLEGTNEHISKKLGISKDEINFTLNWMKRNEIIKENGGVFEVQTSQLLYHEKIPTQKQTQLLKTHIGYALKALEVAPKETKRYLSHSFTMERKSFLNIVQQFSDLGIQVVEECDTQKPECLMQLNIQFFEALPEVLTES